MISHNLTLSKISMEACSSATVIHTYPVISLRISRTITARVRERGGLGPAVTRIADVIIVGVAGRVVSSTDIVSDLDDQIGYCDCNIHDSC